MRILLALLLLAFSFTAEAQNARRIQSSDVTGALGYTPIRSINGMTGVITCGSGLTCGSQVLSLTNLTGDVTSVGNVTTLTSVNPNVGSFGSATQCVSFTTNAKGLITAASATPCTASVASLSGLGVGVATALAINVGSAGSVITNGGALGTPSSGTLTNATGLPIATGVTGLGTGIAAWLGTPSSANLRAALTDETGTGLAYFQGGDIGTPSAGVGTNLTSLNATQLTSGTIPAARTNGHQNGTATNDSAAAGEIGEYIESILPVGSATSVTSGTSKTIVSITLSAGDWDIREILYYVPAATTNVTTLLSSISLTNNTFDNTAGRFSSLVLPAFVPGVVSLSVNVPSYRLSLSGSTTVYLVANATFTVSTMTAYGMISARRAR